MPKRRAWEHDAECTTMKIRQLIDMLDIMDPDAEIVVMLVKADDTTVAFPIEDVIAAGTALNGSYLTIYEETSW